MKDGAVSSMVMVRMIDIRCCIAKLQADTGYVG